MIHESDKDDSDLRHTIRSFFQTHQSFSIPKNAVLIRSDERPQFIFFLEAGIVEQTIITQKGQEFILNLYKPGSFFPLMDSIADIPNHYM